MLCRRLAAIQDRAGQLRFSGKRSIYPGLTLHFEEIAAASDRRHFEADLVAGNYGLTEAAIVNTRKIDKFCAAVVIGTEQEDDSNLGEGLYHQDAGHHRMPGKVSLKKSFVVSDVLDAYHPIPAVIFHDAVDQEKRIAVRHEFEDFAYVEGREAAFHDPSEEATVGERSG